METKSKIKWFASIFMAGVVLVLGMMGGNWGTSYAADVDAGVPPHIDYIQPWAARVGSPTFIMIITGDNFGSISTTAVRLTGTGYDNMIDPIQVLDTGISLEIDAEVLVEPKVYTVIVYKSDTGSVPTIPTLPPWDLPSNPVPFVVYVPQFKSLPIIYK